MGECVRVPKRVCMYVRTIVNTNRVYVYMYVHIQTCVNCSLMYATELSSWTGLCKASITWLNRVTELYYFIKSLLYSFNPLCQQASTLIRYKNTTKCVVCFCYAPYTGSVQLCYNNHRHI